MPGGHFVRSPTSTVTGWFSLVGVTSLHFEGYHAGSHAPFCGVGTVGGGMGQLIGIPAGLRSMRVLTQRRSTSGPLPHAVAVHWFVPLGGLVGLFTQRGLSYPSDVTFFLLPLPPKSRPPFVAKAPS